MMPLQVLILAWVESMDTITKVDELNKVFDHPSNSQIKQALVHSFKVFESSIVDSLGFLCTFLSLSDILELFLRLRKIWASARIAKDFKIGPR